MIFSNEGKYKIKNVISLKEFETKDDIKIADLILNIIVQLKVNISMSIVIFFLKINKTPKINFMNTEIVEQICFNENDLLVNIV